MLSATVIGRLGKDAETKAVGSSNVCNFTVATDHGFGDKKITTWVAVAVWGKEAEWCGANLKKGDRVAVSGAGYLRKWESNGKSGAEFTIDAHRVEKLWEKKEGDEPQRGAYGGGNARPGATGQRQPSSRDEALPPGDDDIPF